MSEPASGVSVVCRFRPPNKREKDLNSQICVTIGGEKKSVKIAGQAAKEPFVFDRVYDWQSSQEEVFSNTALPMVKEVMDGYNTTIFAYGQTGSGKTHTMMGDPKTEHKGVIPRLTEAIFDAIENADGAIEFTIKLSYVEIYNEKIRDLLSPDKDNLRIRESSMGVWIEDVSETYVGSVEQVLEVLTLGQNNRAIASTNMNSESSRSHSVLIITLGQNNTKSGTKRGAKLILVDLAGSEKVGKTGAAGQVLKEAQHINKSLSALGNVINALTSGGKKHVPYRDSKLTRLLSDSLGGNSKTCLIVTASPVADNAEETISTLRFGTRAKSIKNRAVINEEKSVEEYKRLLQAANSRISMQEQLIRALEKDVTDLRACLSAVDPAHLKIPVPTLKPRTLADFRPAGEAAGAGAGAADSKDDGKDDDDDDDRGEVKESKSPDSDGDDDGLERKSTTSASSGASSPRPASSAAASSAASPEPSRAASAESSSSSVSAGAAPAAAVGTTPPAAAATSADAAATAAALMAAQASAKAAEELVNELQKKTASLVQDNADLLRKFDDLDKENKDLKEQIDDKTRDFDEQLARFNEEIKKFQAQVAEVSARRDEAESKAALVVELTTELDLLKKKKIMDDKENQLQIQQLIDDGREMQAKVAKLHDVQMENRELKIRFAQLSQQLQVTEQERAARKQEREAKAAKDAADKEAADKLAAESAKAAAAADAEAKAKADAAAAAAASTTAASPAKAEAPKDSAAAVASPPPAESPEAKAAAVEPPKSAPETPVKPSAAIAAVTPGGAAGGSSRGSVIVASTPVALDASPLGRTPAALAAAAAATPGTPAPLGRFASGTPSTPQTAAGAQAALQADMAPGELFAGGGAAVPAAVADGMTELDILRVSLQRKCDQYMKLQQSHMNRKEHLAMVEAALEAANKKLKENMVSERKKMKALEEKLASAEALVRKLLESGMYWRQQRRTQASSSQKIVVPMHGGGRKPGAADVKPLAGGGAARPAAGGPPPRQEGKAAVPINSKPVAIGGGKIAAGAGKSGDSMARFF